MHPTSVALQPSLDHRKLIRLIQPAQRLVINQIVRENQMNAGGVIRPAEGIFPRGGFKLLACLEDHRQLRADLRRDHVMDFLRCLRPGKLGIQKDIPT